MGESGLGSQAWNDALRILTLHIGLIEFIQRFIEADLALLLFDPHSLDQIADIGDCHISASAAAFDIIRAGFTEQSHPRPSPDGEDIFFIFQKNHALCRSTSGQRNMVCASCHSSSVFSQREHRLIKVSRPF